MADFDWYQGSAPVSAVWLSSALRDRYEGAVIEPCRPSNSRYRHAEAVMVSDRKVCEILNDRERYEHPLFISTSDDAPEFARHLRELVPDHYCTRVDVREDFFEPGLYDRLYPRLIELAQQHRTSVDCRGAGWVTDTPSRTLYLGSVKSPNLDRFYDKSAEQRRACGANRAARSRVPENWTRLEREIKPDNKPARVRLATVAPEEAWGSSMLGVAIAREVLDLDVPRIKVGTVWRPSDHERAMRTLSSQYWRPLTKEIEQLEDDGPLATLILKYIEDSRRSAGQ